LRGFHGFIATKAQRKIRQDNRIFLPRRAQRFLANFGVFGRAFPLSELLQKARPYPPGHFSMSHLGSWLKPSFHQHGFNQQKKITKKELYKHINSAGKFLMGQGKRVGVYLFFWQTAGTC